MKKQIAIIEDDYSINQGIALTLGKEEYDFHHFYCLKDVEHINDMDLLILDINLPDGNGLDFLKRIRNTSQIPVLILTANDTEMDEVMGLQLGADDYVTKPFSLMVLRLRVQKLLSHTDVVCVYNDGFLSLDFDRMQFKRHGMEFELSKTELRLLRYMTQNAGITLTRDKLVTYVWQSQDFVEENALSVVIKRLRDKIEDETHKYIHTVYGIGYIFKKGE